MSNPTEKAQLATINRLLEHASARLNDASKAIAALQDPSTKVAMRRIGAAQVELFEAQYQLSALDADLLPHILRGPADDADAALEVTMRRVHEATQAGLARIAIGILDIFIAYQQSPRHLELAKEARARLAKGDEGPPATGVRRMDKRAAKRIVELVLKASGELDESVAFVRDNCSEAQFLAHREAVGRAMEDLWVSVLKPIFGEHPDLEPEGLRD